MEFDVELVVDRLKRVNFNVTFDLDLLDLRLQIFLHGDNYFSLLPLSSCLSLLYSFFKFLNANVSLSKLITNFLLFSL